MDKKTAITDLTTGSTTKILLKFSWPFMLSNLLQILYNMADMVAVGQYIGSVGLSAVANGGKALVIATMVCMGFASAGQIIVSQSIGRGSIENMRKSIGTIFTCMFGLCVLVSAISFVGFDWLLNVINTPPEAMAGARTYGIACIWGFFFVYQYNAISAILRGIGDSKRPLIFIAIAALTNIILNVVFISWMNMGVFGAALSTIIGQFFSFLCSAVYLYKRQDIFGFDFRPKSFIPDMEILKAFLKLGVPIALQHCTIIFSQLVVSSYVNSYGLIASAVTSVGEQLGRCAMVVTNALSMASTSIIGQCLGAGKLDKIRRNLGISLVFGLIFATILSTLMIAFPEQLFSIFTPDPDVLEMSHSYVLIAVLGFFGFAVRSPFMALINGVGNSILAFVIGIVDGVLGRVFLAIFMGVTLNMGIQGFWLGDVFAGYIPFFIGGMYFLSGRWKKRETILVGK